MSSESFPKKSRADLTATSQPKPVKQSKQYNHKQTAEAKTLLPSVLKLTAKYSHANSQIQLFRYHTPYQEIKQHGKQQIQYA